MFDLYKQFKFLITMKRNSIFSVFILSLFYYGLSYSQLTLPVTFDNGAVTYTLIDFGNVSSSLVADPLNGSNTVVQTIKAPGAEFWGGTTIGASAFATPFPFGYILRRHCMPFIFYT